MSGSAVWCGLFRRFRDKLAFWGGHVADSTRELRRVWGKLKNPMRWAIVKTGWAGWIEVDLAGPRNGHGFSPI